MTNKFDLRDELKRSYRGRSKKGGARWLRSVGGGVDGPLRLADARGEFGIAWACERLEDRLLMATDCLEVSSQDSQGEAIVLEHSRCITVKPGAILNAAGGDIRLNAPEITIGQDSQLLSRSPNRDGVISLKSENITKVANISIWNQIQTLVQAGGQVAKIDIGERVVLDAGGIEMSTSAGDELSAGLKDYNKTAYGQLYDITTSIVNNLTSLPLTGLVRTPASTIVIGTNAQVRSTSAVSVSSTVSLNQMGQAVWSTLADRVTKGAIPGGIAAGFILTDVEATASLATGASIKAAAGVSLATSASNVSLMFANASGNTNAESASKKSTALAVTINQVKSTSRVSTAVNSAIEAGSSVALNASGVNVNMGFTTAASYDDGMVGAAYSHVDGEATVEVLVDGKITAGKSIAPSKLTFSPTLQLDFARKALVFPTEVGLQTGDEVRYSNGGGWIPGLASDRRYYAIVDSTAPRELGLALTPSDAQAGNRISFGTGFPTLRSAKGILPITSVDAAGRDALQFDVEQWLDQSPLFTNGEEVTYTPLAGHYLGWNDAAGNLLGALPAGNYRVRVLDRVDGDAGASIQLLDSQGRVIDLNDNPLFRTEDGRSLQVFGFDAASGTVHFNFPKQGTGEGDLPLSMPRQVVDLLNGQPITYMQAMGTRVPGLEDGRRYHAIVDPETPGVVRLADSESQARAADPRVQDAKPSLETQEADASRRRTLVIDRVEAGLGLVFSQDPQLVDGTPVVFRQVTGKPVEGVTDGLGYFAFNESNPDFDATRPRYVVSLRAAADRSPPAIDLGGRQKLRDARGVSHELQGIDPDARLLAVSLPLPVIVKSAISQGLVGGKAGHDKIDSRSLLVWTNATGGSFQLAVTQNGQRVVSAPIAFDATPEQIRAAATELPGVALSRVTGRGRYAAPWLLQGGGLELVEFDEASLHSGEGTGAVWASETSDDLQAVWTDASAGAFSLTLDVDGVSLVTPAIPVQAAADEVERIVSAVAGVHAQVRGDGTAGSPWLLDARQQPFRSGDALVFQDAWGAPATGMLHGETYYAVVQPWAEQGKEGAVTLGLAATREEALQASPSLIPLASRVRFRTPEVVAMSGSRHELATGASGIDLQAMLISIDGATVKGSVGEAVGPIESLSEKLYRKRPATEGADAPEEAIRASILSAVGNRGSVSDLVDLEFGGLEGDVEQNQPAEGRHWLKGSGAAARLHIRNQVRVVVGETAKLMATGDIGLTSVIVEMAQTAVDAGVTSSTNGSLAAAVGVGYARIENSSLAIVHANAQVLSGGAISVISVVDMPWAGRSKLLMSNEPGETSVAEVLKRNWPTILLGLLSPNLGINSLFVNHWVQAHVHQKAAAGSKGEDTRSKFTVSGSISWVDIDNHSVARIEDGAQINQFAGETIQGKPLLPGDNPVSVIAQSDVGQVNFAGSIYFDLSLTTLLPTIAKLFRRDWSAASSLLKLSGGGKMLGGSGGYVRMANDTRALVGGIEEPEKRRAKQPLRLSYGGLGLTVYAANSNLLLQMGQSGTAAQDFGLAGSASIVDVQGQKAHAAILGTADPMLKPSIRPHAGTEGDVLLNSEDNTWLIPIAGAVLTSASKNVGVSVAIARMDRDVASWIGADEAAEDVGGPLDLETGGHVLLIASATGKVTPSSLAASIASGVKPQGRVERVSGEQPPEAGQASDSVFGLAISGDYSEATLTDQVRAWINGRDGKLQSLAAAHDKMLMLSAKNSTLVQASAGAASFESGQGSSLGLAGAASVITYSSTVRTLVRRMAVEGYLLNLESDHARPIGSLAASGKGARQGTQGTVTLQLAGSVTIVDLTTVTEALLDRVVGTSLTSVSLKASRGDKIWSGAGSFLLGFSLTGGTPGGSALGIGSSVAVHREKTTTHARVVGSRLTLVVGDLALAATEASRIITVSAGVAVSGAGSTLSGMNTSVLVDTSTQATIEGTVTELGGDGNVSVLATSALLLVSASGDLVLGRSAGSAFGVGAGVTVTNVTVHNAAKVERSSLRVKRGSVTVRARTRNPGLDEAIDKVLNALYTPHRENNAIWSFAAGVAGSNASVNLSFSVDVNTLAITQEAIIGPESTILVDDGSLTVEVLDEAGIYSGAGQIAAGAGGGEKSAAGAAVVRNRIAVVARALIDRSSVTVNAGNRAAGTVTVNATSAALIGAAAVGAEFAGKAGAGTSLVFNEVEQLVEAKVTGTAALRSSIASSGDVSILAVERSRIGSGAGQVAIATSGRAAGAAAATNQITSRVSAVVEDSSIAVTQGAALVKADAKGEIFSYAVGVSGAWSSAPNSLNLSGVGSGTGNTLVRQVEATLRSSSNVTSAALSVLASDSAKIDTAAGTLAIQYAGKPGISAAIGISASTNTIGSFEVASPQRSFVRATIEDSTVTVRGPLKLSAEASLQVQSVTAAGAGEVSSGQGWGVGIAGAGAGSRNTIQMDVHSRIWRSSVTLDRQGASPAGDDSITIHARNASEINAIAGGVKLAGSGGNVKGVNVTVGAAASVNEVRITTQARMDDTRVSGGAGIQMDAAGEARIRAISFGVAGAARGGPGGLDLSGAGSASLNTVRSETQATIGQGSVIGTPQSKAASVSLTAVDRSSIVAGSGGMASMFALGEGAGLGLSIGVSYSINEITGFVKATVDKAIIHATGNVSLDARFEKGQNDHNLFSVSVAGAAGVAAGSGGVLFPLAGAGNRNTVAMVVEAALRNTASVSADAGLSLMARDESDIYSNAGGVGLGLSWGGAPSGGVAIGAAYGKNEIGNQVRATIEGSAAVTKGGATLRAESKAAIESVGFGVALDANVAGAAISAAGSGAGAYNVLTNRTEALIVSSEVDAGTLDVLATDTPRIRAGAGAGALAVTIGNGAALATGAIVIENTLANQVHARIGRLDESSAAPTVRVEGALNLVAESRAQVEALAVAVAVSAAFSEFSAALSGAGARSTVSMANEVLAAIEAGSVAATEVKLRSAGGDRVTKNEVGTGALSGAIVGGSVGVSLAENFLRNRVETRLGDAQVSATRGDIRLQTQLGHGLAAESVATSVAVALGGSGAGGHAISQDQSKLFATVAAQARLVAPNGGLDVSIDGDGTDAIRSEGSLSAYAHGGSLGLVSVGAVIAKATSEVERKATIEGNVDLSSVRFLNLSAIAKPNLSAWSVAADVGGVAVLVNQSTVRAAGTAQSTTGTGVTLPREVQLMAFAAPVLNVEQTGVNAGGVAAGATQSTAESSLITEAILGADTRSPNGGLGLVRVSAISRDEATRVKATAGTGGLFSGFGTTGDVVDTTRTTASLLGGTIEAETVDLSALRHHRYDLDVSSVNVGVGAGVGATLARLKSNADVAVNLSDGMKIVAKDTVTLRTHNTLQQFEDGYTVDGGGGSLLFNGLVTSSSADVQASSKINLGHRVSIQSGVDAYDRRGGIHILPDVSLTTNDSVIIRNLGLLSSSSATASSVKATLAPQVLLGDQVELSTRGDLSVGTTAFVQTRNRTDGWGGGLIASGIATSASGNVTVDQAIQVGEQAVFRADGTLSVTTGDDPTGGSSTVLGMDTDAHAAVRSLVAVPTASASSRLMNASRLVFGAGANVTSGMSMYLAAQANKPETKATGLAEGYQVGFIRTTSGTSSTDPKTDSQMQLRGTFTAGRDNAVEILVPRGRPEAITATPSTLGGQAVSWTIDPQFRPQEYVQQKFTADVAQVLAQGLSQTPVQAITLGPLRVSGGSVDIAADTLLSGDATITAKVGRIRVLNESPAYLITGPMSIANVEGGQVRLRRSNAVDSIAAPSTWKINREDAVATLAIEQLFDGAVGASSYGPAVLLDGAVQNLGGNVSIKNVSGSFGQRNTIAAKKIEMHIPSGVTVIDIPTQDWHLATVPPVTADRSFAMLWPGGNPRNSVLKADQAVMYAINAMSRFRKPESADDSDGALEDRVYGRIDENRESYNFFGGSVPWSSYGRDSHDENARISRDARPDQVFKSRRFGVTDRADSGWLPALQPLPTSYSSLLRAEQEAATSLFGDVVVINARTVNINAEIRAGRDSSGSDSVILPAELDADLRDYQARYRQGLVVQAEYRIPADRLRRNAEQDRLIGATFDARSGQIRLDEAASTSGKLVSITGRIINTNANSLAGKIHLRGGSGDITVRNETSWPLVTGNLYTGGTGHKSVISINDLLVEDRERQQTAYAYDGTDILVYQGPAGEDLTEGTPIQRVVNQDSTAYQPQADLRWQWTLEAKLSRDVNFDLNRWTGVNFSSWRFDYPAGQADTPWRFVDGDATAGSIVKVETDQTFRQELSASWANEARLVQPYRSQPGPYATGIVNDREFRYPREVTLRMTNSLKAAYPIGVDFSGTSFGTVQVWSQGPLLLSGTLQSPAVKLESAGSILSIEARGQVDAERLELSAVGDIGSVSSPLSFHGDRLAATSLSGGISLLANPFDNGRNVTLEGLAAPQGRVLVQSGGSVLGKLASDVVHVRARSVELLSAQGSVGTIAQPIVLDAAREGDARESRLTVDALAEGPVHLRQFSGDMLVGRIHSRRGSVQVETTGSIYDAASWSINEADIAARLESMRELGVTDPNAYLQDVATLETGVTGRYQLYWRLRNDGTIVRGRLQLRDNALPLWTIRAAEKLQLPNPTNEQVRAFAADLFAQQEAFFEANVGPDWKVRTEFRAYQPAFRYVASAAQVEQLRKDRTLNEVELALKMGLRALQTADLDAPSLGEVNVRGRGIRIASEHGSVGKIEAPVRITTEQLASGMLTQEQRLQLGLAGLPGDAVRAADGLILSVRRPLTVQVSGGRLDVEAPRRRAICGSVASTPWRDS